MESPGGPPQGSNWQPATSGNSISWDGAAVIKRYVRAQGLETEKLVISNLTELPLPRLLADSTTGSLRTRFVEGLPGTEAVECGMAGMVLHELGEFLKLLHQVDTGPFFGKLAGTGEVLVHGDFAHYNGVFESGSGKLAAVLDWETAHLGDRIADLAWAEYQFRTRFPREAWAVRNLFQGYGSEPDSVEREVAVQRRLEYLSTIEGGGNDLHYALTFADVPEASCFVAALLRFLSSPDGRSNAAWIAGQIWVDHPATVLLNGSALEAASSRFGRLPAAMVAQLPSSSRLIGAGQFAAAIGKEEADIFFANR